MSPHNPPRIAVISLERWDEVWRRNQHLVVELLRQNLAAEVTFVEPPEPGWRAIRGAPHPGVRLVRPPLPFPRRCGGLRLAALWLRRFELGSTDLLWINDPSLGAHCGSGRVSSFYDVTDDWREADQVPRIRRRIVTAEDRLARTSATVVCSAELARRWHARYGIEPTIVRNAASDRPSGPQEPVVHSGAAPHVGYLGTLQQERIDVELTLAIARSPHVGTVHLVGPDHLSPAARAKLLAVPKLCIEPPVPAHTVPALLATFDVLVAPHLVTSFTMSLDAIKAFEYLATSRPVVATPTSGFQEVAAPGLRVTSADTFVAAVEAALATGGTFQRSVPGWAERAREFAAAFPGDGLAPGNRDFGTVRRAGRSARRRLRHLAMAVRHPTASFGAGCDLRQGVALRMWPGARVTFGPRCVIDSRTTIECHGALEVGADVIFGHGATIGVETSVTIGADCLIAELVSIRDHDHEFADDQIAVRRQGPRTAAVVIEEDVWIGSKATITAGVTVGAHAIVAAGAVVTADVEAWSIVGGVPARRIGARPRRDHPGPSATEVLTGTDRVEPGAD